MADGTNRYAYVGNNLVNRADPSGHQKGITTVRVNVGDAWIGSLAAAYVDPGCVVGCTVDVGGLFDLLLGEGILEVWVCRAPCGAVVRRVSIAVGTEGAAFYNPD